MILCIHCLCQQVNGSNSPARAATENGEQNIRSRDVKKQFNFHASHTLKCSHCETRPTPIPNRTVYWKGIGQIVMNWAPAGQLYGIWKTKTQKQNWSACTSSTYTHTIECTIRVCARGFCVKINWMTWWNCCVCVCVTCTSVELSPMSSIQNVEIYKRKNLRFHFVPCARSFRWSLHFRSNTSADRIGH